MATTVDGSTGVSQIQDDKVTVDKLNLISTGSVPSLEAKGTSGVTSGYLKLNCSENSHGIKLLGPPHSAAADYTLTFPNNDGDADQFLQTNGSGVMTWAAAGGMTLLSTVATTSGTEVVAGSLTLTGYQSLMIYASDVGVTAGASLFRWKETGGTYSTIAYTNTTSSVPVYTVLNHNLITGVTGINPNSYSATNTAANLALTAGSAGSGTNTGIDQATTSITFSTVASQTFNRGQILIYGLK